MQRPVTTALAFIVLKAFVLYMQGAHSKLILHQEADEGEGRHLIIDSQFVFCEF